MFKSKELTVVDKIRSVQRSTKANKQCANCGEMGPVYVCMDFHTFVCTECSGLHRELSHKVKSISMSNWNMDEFVTLESGGGNERDHQIYLATHDARIYPIPTSANKDKLREFIRLKYIEKRWIGSSNPSAVVVSDSWENEPSNVKEKKDKKAKQNVHFDDSNVDLVSFGQNAVGKESANLSTSISLEEQIHSHFSRGIELLEKLYQTNGPLAQSITKTVQASLSGQFLNTRSSTPASDLPVVSIGVPTNNPFDFLIPPPVQAAPIIIQDNSPNKTHLVPPVFANISSVQVSPNPFDIFQL